MIWVLLLTLPWLVLCLHTFINAKLFRRLADFSAPPTTLPKVSILIPARNEEQTLPILLPSLLAQDYPNLEIIVLNDHSTDSTQAVLETHASSVLRIIQGQELKTGWRGKPNACQQLAQAATGEILAFTDADTIWNPKTTQNIVQAMQQTQADALSVWSEQILSTTLGKIVQPFMAWSLVGLLPMRLAEDSRYPEIVSANGQLFVYKKEVYFKFGGFERVKDSILEDIEAAKLLKKEGYHYVFMNGVGSISCKMYNSSKEALDGFAKSNFAAIGYSPFGYIATSLLFIWLHWMPLVWLQIAPNPVLPMLTIALMLLCRARSDIECKYPVALSLLAPVSVLAWVYITGVSWYRYAVGKVTWKGRSYDLR